MSSAAAVCLPSPLSRQAQTADDVLVMFFLMGIETIGAVLASVGEIHKLTAARRPQRIERAVAEQAVEVLRVCTGMTGKVFTCPVRKIGILFVHAENTSVSSCGLQQYNRSLLKTQSFCPQLFYTTAKRIDIYRS